MSDKILTRMGDGERLRMAASAVKEAIAAGSEDAGRRAKISPLTEEEQEQLFDIMADPSRVVGVSPGEEVIVTDDAATMSFYTCQDGGGIGVPLSRMQAILVYERACGADTTSMGHSDCSFKPVKPIVNFEMNEYYTTSLMTTVPFFYCAQPNMGLYYRPDGPCSNPADLMPAGKIAEAREAQEQAAEYLKKDLVFVGKKMASVGCEGLNLDTSGSAGDTDFMAALQAVKELKKQLPHMPIIVGSANEFILGMHGTVTFNGQRLAGMYPHKQVKVVEEAGADIYGLAVNTNTNESTAWNLARTLTFVKETVKVAKIPVHVNVGMGVGGVPMMESPPPDSVTRISKALAQIGKIDGLQIGVGDPLGMHLSHIMASGMGGIRTTGDLVAWMQISRKMKLLEAKKYVANKLGIKVIDLTDEDVMRPLREDLGIGTITSVAGSPKGIRAKIKIAELLDIPINSVTLFKSQLGASLK